MRYRLSRQAAKKIDEIIEYTDTNFGQAQTEEYVGGLTYSFDLLCDNPQLGRLWERHRRCYIYRVHYVFYRLLDDHILITDIRSTRQAIPKP